MPDVIKYDIIFSHHLAHAHKYLQLLFDHSRCSCMTVLYQIILILTTAHWFLINIYQYIFILISSKSIYFQKWPK